MIASYISYGVWVILGLVAVVLEVRAFVDAVRRSPDTFTAADKRTKTFWSLLLAAGLFFGYLALPPVPLGPIVLGAGLGGNLFMILAVLPAAIYLADVKPEVARFSRRPPRSSGGW